jgi:SAM-dependent methyltransferase
LLLAASEDLKEWEKAEVAYEDAMAEIYEESYYGSWLQRHYMRDFARLIRRELPRQARILDIGCGTGLLLAELRRHGFRDLHGIDLSPRMIEKARENFDGPLYVGSCYQLPFPDEHFDAIIISSMLHHLPDVPRPRHALKVYLKISPRVALSRQSKKGDQR